MLTFQELLAPHDGDFLECVMGQSALYIDGAPTKFADLFSWNDLNHLLEFGGLTSPRLRMFGNGIEIAPDFFLKAGASGFLRPRPVQVSSVLLGGAVLVVQSIEELCRSISHLCQACESILKVPVMADLYANCTVSNPGAVRWNDQETLLLQLDGRRAWKLYPPTRLNPMPHDPPPEPAGEPVWEGMLSNGDLLYIPRGWWYTDAWVEPALYLAAKFRNPTGLDVLSRVLQSIAAHEEIRGDCPRFGSLERHCAFLRILQSEMAEACARPGLILGFLEDFADVAEPRVRFNLPWTATPAPGPPSDDVVVMPLLRFSRAESVVYSRNEDAVEVFFEGKFIKFPIEVGDILKRICERPHPSVGTLREGCSRSMSEEQFNSSLSALIRCGIAAFE